MLPRDLLRNQDFHRNGKTLSELLAHRGVEPEDLNRWSTLDAERRELIGRAEELMHQRNAASKEIGQIKRQGGDAGGQIAAVSGLKQQIDEFQVRRNEIDSELAEIEMGLPNLPHETVPEGTCEADNCLERTVGEPPRFDFEPQAHYDLGPALGILDFERAAKLAGARFTTYFGAGARLERALIQLMLDLHLDEHGYREVIPPFIVNQDCLTGTGQLPKFAEDLFKLEGHSYYLIPTAEVPLTNLHREEVLDESQLPMRYVAHTPCFRGEAGSYGKDVRGLFRQHQFNKVELVQLVTPEKSYEALEELTSHAEKVLQRLELPYRTMCLSTGDMGFSAAKTYDLEVWLPGQDKYREISSCSNCEDFQARRANLKYRPEGGGKPRLLHTLNGSGLAVGRTLIAVLENGQQADGSILLPEALRPYMGGQERITAAET